MRKKSVAPDRRRLTTLNPRSMSKTTRYMAQNQQSYPVDEAVSTIALPPGLPYTRHDLSQPEADRKRAAPSLEYLQYQATNKSVPRGFVMHG